MNQHMSNADLLTEVNMAIQKICIGGQSYQIGTKRLTRADLTQLYKNEERPDGSITGGREYGPYGKYHGCIL